MSLNIITTKVADHSSSLTTVCCLLLLLLQERTQPLSVYHPNPGESRLACQLTEEEQVRIAQRIGLIQHLPRGFFDPGSDPADKKVKE